MSAFFSSPNTIAQNAVANQMQAQEIAQAVDMSNAAGNNAAGAPLKRERSVAKKVTPKDFFGPVKPPTAFMFFSNCYREQIGDEYRATLGPNEAFKVSAVASRLGAKWKNMPEKERDFFNKQMLEAKAQYEADLEKWQTTDYYRDFVKASAEIQTEKKKAVKSRKLVKVDGLPKPTRPKAGFMRFTCELRSQVKEELLAKGVKYSIGVGAKLTKEKWDALGEEGQKPYNDAYKQDWKIYEEELTAWKARAAGQESSEAETTDAKRKAESETEAERPVKIARRIESQAAAMNSNSSSFFES